MSEIVYNWISVGDSMFERIELYKNDLEKTFDNFVPAPFGGPILIIHENLISIHAASGAEISKWKWRTGEMKFETFFVEKSNQTTPEFLSFSPGDSFNHMFHSK